MDRIPENKTRMVCSVVQPMAQNVNHKAFSGDPEEANVRTSTRYSISGLENDWSSLLARSDADPLFMSYQWLETWWRLFGQGLGGRPVLVVAKTGERLCGLVPLYRRQVTHRGGFPGTRLEMIGGAWRASGVGLSERMGFLVEVGAAPRILEALASELLADRDWDDLVVTYAPKDGLTAGVLERMAQACGGYLRRPDRMDAWKIPLVNGLDAFRDSLGSNTRARIFGSRKRLSASGQVREWIADTTNLETALDLLDELYRGRWGRGFNGYLRQLYGTLAVRQTLAGHPAVSVLEYNQRPVSVLLNLRAGGCEYAIASAFREVDVKRVSPGWLHLGMAIERAAQDGMTHFDLLGGNGKHEPFKRHLGGERSELVSFQLIRTPWLALVYRSWDSIRNALSRSKVPAA
jgi:CelD/BcsL family acetyltransferase involved in cellulose biosynthesis